jgi:hypothetical protein
MTYNKCGTYQINCYFSKGGSLQNPFDLKVSVIEKKLCAVNLIHI